MVEEVKTKTIEGNIIMKYRVGQKVKIVEKEYISYGKNLKLSDPPFVLTILCDHHNGYYTVKENDGHWWKGNIEGVYYPEIFDPILSRFEILDL